MLDISELTIGIEEEYQIIDAESRELTSYVGEFMKKGGRIFQDQVKPEFLQSQIEVGSHVCRNIKEVRLEICRLRNILNDIAVSNNRRIVAAGTHPFSSWQDQVITDHERYHGLFNSMQYVAKRLLIFGMHIHIGIKDPDLRIDIMNQMRYFLPHILSLSTSSPFWRGTDTGLKSYRSIVFEDLPRTGIPVSFDSAHEYNRYVDTLISCESIDDPSKIWWDIRPHHKLPTLEFRVCDCTTKVDEVVAIAAFVQALVAKLILLRKENRSWRMYRSSLINENKWRATKDGISGKLIDFGKRVEVPTLFLMEEGIDLVADVAEQLGSTEEIEYIRNIIKDGTSADRQLDCFHKTGSMESVVDMLAEETMEGC